MTTDEATVQESPGLVDRVTTTVGGFLDSLRSRAPSTAEVRSAVRDQTAKVGGAFDSLKRKAPTTEEVRGAISDQTTKLGDAYGQAKATIGLRDYDQVAQMLEAWLPTLAKEDGLPKKVRAETKAAIAWLADLPEERFRSFVRDLYSFGLSFDFDLVWLLDPEIVKLVDEGLRQAMIETVQLYCLSVWKADQMQDGLKLFVNLQKWLAKPFAKRYGEFNKRLFTKLLAEDLVPAPPLELFLAPEEEREAYSVQAIKGLLAEDNQRFYRILRTEVELAAAEPEFEAGEDSVAPEAEADEDSAAPEAEAGEDSAMPETEA